MSLIDYIRKVGDVIEVGTKRTFKSAEPGVIIATTVPRIDSGRRVQDIMAVRESTMSVIGLSGSISGGTFASNNGLTVKFPDSIVWTKDGTIPLIIIDGVKSSLGDVKPTDISRVEVLKNDRAIAKYGNAGRTGAIEITTYKSMEQVKGTVTGVGTLSNLNPVRPGDGQPYITTTWHIEPFDVTQERLPRRAPCQFCLSQVLITAASVPADQANFCAG
jgi:hypothetical protein